MIKTPYFSFLGTFILSITICGCSYDNSGLDVTSIDLRDGSNQTLGSTGDISKQWKEQQFTSTELALFSSLDTANLAGTSYPTSVRQSTAFPNPFHYYTSINHGFEISFTAGYVVTKYVIVNSSFHLVESGSMRMNNTFYRLNIGNSLPPGKYRAYVSLSASGHEHFYTYWGNIWKN